MLAATWAAMPVSTTHAIVGEAPAMSQRSFPCPKAMSCMSVAAVEVFLDTDNVQPICKEGHDGDRGALLARRFCSEELPVCRQGRFWE